VGTRHQHDDEPGLFEVEAIPAVSRQVRREREQRRQQQAGYHPLSGQGRPGTAIERVGLRLHPDARSGAPGAPTCGTCRWRQAVNMGSSRDYPKCRKDWPARYTRGPGTDVRASWPGCVDWQAKGRDTDTEA
jgi:hypothetical protein